MKKLISLMAALAISVSVYAQSPVSIGDWELTFEDEFVLEHLDQNLWHHGGSALHTNGMAANTGEGIWTEGGNLNIRAEKRQAIFGGYEYEYASSEISTFPVFRQAYGYFEARIKFDAVQGAWPAFWLMPDNGARGPAEDKIESYLRFAIDTTKGPFSQAILKIKVRSKSSENVSNVSVHELLSDDWNEETICWNNKPSYDPIFIRQFTGTTDPERVNQLIDGEFIVIDVTHCVNDALEANTFPGFALIDKFMRIVEVEFFSKEATSDNDKPRLLIDGETILPSDDAYVRGGSYSTSNYGEQMSLKVHEPWRSVASTYNGGMEVDILESLGIWGENYNQNALHWDGYGDDHKSTGSSKYQFPASDDGFHTYGLHWRPGKLEFFVDDSMTWEWESERVASIPSYMILTHQIGGWDGNTNVKDSLLPLTMQIDYVRVYKDLNGASLAFRNLNDGDILSEYSDVLLEVDIIEYGGKISKLAFYSNEELLTIDSIYPYSYEMPAIQRGKYRVRAEGINPDGMVLSRDSIEIIVSEPPAVSIQSPENGAVFSAPSILTFDIEASSESGSVEKVDLFIQDSLTATETEFPYSFRIQKLPPGKYEFFARVTDDLGLSTNSEKYEINITGEPLSLPWQGIQIGDAEVKGYESQYDGSIIIEGGGEAYLGARDHFNFAYQTLHGDGEIIARLSGVEDANDASRIGIVMRDNLLPGSMCVAMSLSDGGSVLSFRRSQDKQASNLSTNDHNVAPYWFKLKRTENNFTGFTSVDGKEWKQCFNPIPVEMKDRIFIGLAVSAVSNEEACMAVFDHISLQGETYANQSPLVRLLSPMKDTVIQNLTSFELRALVYDPDGGNIEKLDYLADSVLIGSGTSEPFSFRWNNLTEGIYGISALATDDEGTSSRSDTVWLEVRQSNFAKGYTMDDVNLIIFPVPASEKLHLNFLHPESSLCSSIRIYNVFGEEVITMSREQNELEIPLEGLSNGLYVLELESNGRKFFRQFTVAGK